ncbi:MAG: oxamate carbamoyltransferase subunit AllH family protein [Thermoleophilia bacterium]
MTDVVASEPPEAYGVDVELAQAAVAALAEGDATAACGLLGSGPGLTPAGDDVVAGALAALALMERLPLAAAAAVTAAAPSRTTALSASLLVAAARGQVVPEAARTLRALARGDDDETVGALARRLFAVGATSGHDLALGLATALTSATPDTAREAS